MISCSLREQVVWNQPQVLAPNVGSWGNEYHYDSIRETVDAVDAALRDANLDLFIKKGFVAFTPDTIHRNSLREGHHTFWVCLSLHRNPNGELRSEWVNSDLVKRAIVINAPMACMSSFYDPTKGTFVSGDTHGRDLGSKQQSRMALSGVGFMKALRKQLWSGMGCTPLDRAAWIDSTPYFTDGPEAIMMGCSNSKEPTEMFIMPITVDIGIPAADSDYINENICKHIKFNLKRKMLEHCKQKAFSLPGFQVAAKVVPGEGQRPGYNVEEFKSVFPSGPKHLPLRAAWLNDLNEIITAPIIQEELAELVKAHNATWNPSGKPWTDDSKRAADTEAGGSQKKTKSIPADPKAPKEEKDLGDYVKFQHEGQDIFITASGQLWCHGLKDDVLSVDLPVALVFGEFTIDSAATEVIEKLTDADTQTLVFNLGNAGSITSFEMPKGGNQAAFSEAPCSIEAACQYAEQGSFDVPDMFALHEVKPKTVKDGGGEVTGRTYEVKCKTPCIFTAKKSPRAKKQLNADDAGYMIILGDTQKTKWKHVTGEGLMHESGHVTIVLRMGQHGNLFFKIAPSLREIDKANLSRNPDSIMLMP